MRIDLRSINHIVIELTNGKKYDISTEGIVSEHLYIRREDESHITVSGFTDRTVKLGQFRDIKVS